MYKDKYVAWDPQISYYYRRMESSRNVDDNSRMAQRIADIRQANESIYREYGMA